MNTQQAYDVWSNQYDSNENKTRDLEAVALRTVLSEFQFDNFLEIGCGTGKNTVWLVSKCNKITAIDLSTEMLAKAKEKIDSDKVEFIQADILQNWNFVKTPYDIVSFSLVLEHIEDLDPIFEKLVSTLKPEGYIYIGELHPFKQYAGTKAQFETEKGLQFVNCFDHHISDFTEPAKKYGFEIEVIKEFFDDNDRKSIPRILSLLFKKKIS